jgi:transmembrane sensor
MDANERRARATHEATQWWNRLAIERPSEIARADRESFTQWLRESPLHVAELLRIAHVHDALERFNLWDEIEVDARGEAHNVVPLHEVPDESAEVLAADMHSAEESSSAPGRAARRSPLGIWTVAASTCLVALTGAWLALGSREGIIETELAERRQIMLTDGTVVQLEPETQLRVRFEDHERHVVLERGRALFRVAKDAQRPFWVSANQASVRAVGTAFGVESAERGVIVTVAEGKVAVWRAGGELPPGEGPAMPILTAGQQVTVQSTGALESVRTVDTARALAWAQGQLVFENDTLADVVGEFNRYNRTQLYLDDRRLASRRVSGVFEATDTETLLAFIRQGGSDITITQTDARIVIGSSSR